MARKKTPSPIVLAAFGHAVAAYIWLVRRTLRWEIVGGANHDQLVDAKTPFILASWHGRLLSQTIAAKKHQIPSVALSSNHKDGEFMVAVFKRLKIDAVRGSSSNSNKREKDKGGAAAFRGLLAAIKAGKMVGLTPDGPRGPAGHAQAGIIRLSSRTSVPILPVAFSTRAAKRFNSWDRFMLPLPIPFAKAFLVFGEVHTVSGRDSDVIESERKNLEAQIDNVTAEADRLAGVALERKMHDALVTTERA